MVGVLVVKATELVYSCERPVTQVGRRADCEVMLDDASVSRLHAQIERRREGYLVVDQNSRNGTRVNGIMVLRQTLRSGDEVHFGNVCCIYQEVDDLPDRRHLANEGPRNGEKSAGGDVEKPTMAVDLRQFGERAPWLPVLSWQAVQAFSDAEGDEGARLRAVIANLAGVQDVEHVTLYVCASGPDPRPRWLKEGAATMRSRFSEEKLMDVVQSGMAMSLHKGRYVTGVRSAGCDAVCVPLRRRGSTFGALCVESAAELTELVLQLVSATADALALARGIWQGGPDAASRSRDDMADMPVIVGCSKPLQEVFRMAKRYAQVDSTVLIRGATGTGKELFAKMIHSASDRTGQPFVAVNCGAIAPNLVESELFGHEKGAFTGAVGCRKGKFEAAESGTLFLDEVGELPADVQVKLLRVIEERVVTRVGGNATIPVEARIIAATHRDLESAVQTGSFRDDLYHRLRVLELRVPALKDRPEDVPELVKHFIKDLRSRMNTKVQEVAPDAMDVLKAYSWPGNVRELRNVIERSLVLAEGDTLTKDDLAAELVVACSDAKLPSALTSPASGTDLQCVEREHIERVLRECGGNKRVASQRLGISRSTLYEKIRLWHEK